MADEQRHWYETLGVLPRLHGRACSSCRTKRRKLEQARWAWELALKAVDSTPKSHLAVVEAGLTLLEQYDE